MSVSPAGLSGVEQRLADALDTRAPMMRSDLARHVRIPTGWNHKAGLDEYRALLLDRVRAIGAEVELVEGDPRPQWLLGRDEGAMPPIAICRHHRDGAKARVLIACHIDTVFDPHGDFNDLIESTDGETAVGPGVVDMKGGILIALNALEALEEAGVGASWTLVFTSDEETGSFSSERVLRECVAGHDFGICTEPALPGGELAIERMGSGQFMIECRGRASHVGRDFTGGVSAVTALSKALVKISEMPDPERGRILSVGPLKGGDATNAVPDHAAAWGNVRFPTPEVGDEIGAMLDALATPEDTMPRVSVRRAFNRPAKPLIPKTERFALAARAAAESLGQALPFASTGGVCDGNILQDAGLPTIDTLGVRGGGLHTPDEWIELRSLPERAALFAVLLHRIAAGAV
jgi:glutamate carboxypeptidase